jgi:hypothetical protein
MSKGVTLSKEELVALKELLNKKCGKMNLIQMNKKNLTII